MLSFLALAVAALASGDYGSEHWSDTAHVHAGRGGLDPSARIPPIDLSTTYPIPDLEAASNKIKTSKSLSA
jgi:hypothetical protein